MPKPLVGKTTAFGRVGRTLGKAFRDDEELKGAADLGALIQGALDESESLVVICSPRSAPSTYVNEEIANFKRSRLFCCRGAAGSGSVVLKGARG